MCAGWVGWKGDKEKAGGRRVVDQGSHCIVMSCVEIKYDKDANNTKIFHLSAQGPRHCKIFINFFSQNLL
jgi:hypothetical protein